MFGPLPLGWLGLPVTFLWLAGVSNAVNWLDGLDGLATGTVAIAAAMLSIVCVQLDCPIGSHTCLESINLTAGLFILQQSSC